MALDYHIDGFFVNNSSREPSPIDKIAIFVILKPWVVIISGIVQMDNLPSGYHNKDYKRSK